MDLHVALTGRGRLSADVYQAIRDAILDGRLRAGDALPASRELARRLAVSRNTVTAAYQELAAEGFLVGRAGAGTIVTSPPPPTRRRRGVGALAPRRGWREPIEASAAPAAVADDFSIGSPDPTLFPAEAWRRALGHQLRRARRGAGYPPPEGAPELRAAIARHVGLSRGVRADADDVVVTSGAQQAFDLIARVLVAPGARVAVEDPGYPPAWRAFELAGARVTPVRVDAEGLDVAAIPAGVDLVYVTPSHQFPLGVSMSLPRRLALLAWAERTGAAIVEDDYDSEFRYDGRPLEALHNLDRHGRVIYVGTFSKVLLPSLRIGFAIAPPSLVPALRAAKRVADSHGPVDPQRALAALIDDGTFARHLRRLVRSYRERRDRLVAAVERHAAETLSLVPAAAGLHLGALFCDSRTDGERVVERAARQGIAVGSLTPYAFRPRSGLCLGFGLVRPDQIEPAIRRLAGCIRSR